MKFEDLQLLKPFNQFIPAKTLAVSVVVPAKNEAEHLRTTLSSLLEQVDDDGIKVPFKSYEVLLLVNNSNDESLDIALEFKLANPLFCLYIAAIDLPCELANIGTVRKLLMDEACRRFKSLDNERGIIASIDADTSADPQWLYQISREISAGNDAVGGRIFTREKAGPAEKPYLHDFTYRCLLTEAEQILCPQVNDPLPRHFQFFGANMAVTAECYSRSGGIPLTDCLEDMAFHQALIRCDAKIRRSLKVKVTTSARFDGRVAIGFSEQLKKWSDESQEKIPQVVENTANFIQACYLKGQFQIYWYNRDTFDNAAVKELAMLLGVPARWLKTQVMTSTYLGTCWEKVWDASAVRANTPQTFESIDRAIKNLKSFIKNRRAAAFQTNPSGIYQLAGEIHA